MTPQALAAYNAGVERARRAYREDRLRAEGICAECERRPTTGYQRRCYTCREAARTRGKR